VEVNGEFVSHDAECSGLTEQMEVQFSAVVGIRRAGSEEWSLAAFSASSHNGRFNALFISV
jgi:hypothetical protein